MKIRLQLKQIVTKVKQVAHEIFYGTGICATGDCQIPVEPHGYYCDSCTDHIEATNDSESERTRERAFTKHNIDEWKRLMNKYPDIQ